MGTHARRLLVSAAALAATVVGALVPTSAGAAVLVVPTSYPTIQAAVDAASSGDRIRVLAGTYVEQVSITKDLAITGSGAGSTIIGAPAILAPGLDDGNSIVEIGNGASVAMSRLTVSGPGSGTCEDGALEEGIIVLDGGHLDLRFAAVKHIHDSPIAACFRSGDAIQVGVPTGSASAAISYSSIRDYQSVGIVVINAGSTATVTHNVVTGPAAEVSTDGIELVLGAVGTISHNVVSGNRCVVGDPDCGPDFFTQLQHAGIAAGAAGTTVISHNLLFGNQVGMYLFESAQISHNILWNNSYFGMALQDGSFTARHDRISGGAGGVAVIAAFADTLAVLDHVKIARTSGPPVQEFECCGFTATTIGGH